MKKSMLEKTIDYIAKQDQRVRQHQIHHHEVIKKQIMQQKEQFYRLTQGESGNPTFSFGSEMWVCYNYWRAHHYFV